MFRFRKDVYLDNNATTQISKPVLKKMNYILKNCYGNASSLYKIARNSAEVLDESRNAIAASINAKPEEIYFTSCATEANNNVLISLSEKFSPEKKRIISTPIEHPSVLSTLEYLKSKGLIINFVKGDKDGRIDINNLKEMLDPETFLVCCMYANNETGVIQDINEIVKAAHAKNVLVLSDSVQALGKINVDVNASGVDYATFSAHKIHGPKGIGALYVKENNPISPLIHGGHQERGIRAGTESIHNIAGFAEACRHIPEMLEKSENLNNLKQIFISRLKEIKPDIKINSPEKNCLPNTVSVTFGGINNAVLMGFLDFYGIAVAAGSACNTQENKASHVLKAIGLTDEQAQETIRFSFSEGVSQSEINYVIKIIREFLGHKTSPVNMIKPSQLNENLLFDEQTYIFDVRFWYDRKFTKGLPNSHEASFFSFKKYIRHIPKDKNVIVICQGGFNSPIVAYSLKRMGYRNVCFLLTGMIGWRLCYPDLYEKHCGKNITKLKV